MRTRHRHLTVALAVVLVLGSGAVGAALGRTAAAPATPASAAGDTRDGGTESVAVVTPVGRGASGPGDGFGSVLGTVDVPAVGDPALVELAPLDLAAPPPPVPDAVAIALGPVPDGEVLVPPPGVGTLPAGGDGAGGAGGGEGAGADGPAADPGTAVADPCAPVDGPPPAECPEGVRGTILASHSAPELQVFGIVDPPTWSEAAGGTRPVAWCPPASRPGPGAARVTLVTNVPAEIDVTVRRTGAPFDGTDGDERRLTAGTGAAERTSWEADLAADRPYEERWHLLQHCLWLEDLELGATYSGEIRATDILGRTAAARLPLLVADETADLVRPPTRVEPFTDTRVRVSVAHRASEWSDVRAWPVAPGSGPSCEAPDGARQLWGTDPVTGEVAEAAALARGHDPAYDRRTSQVLGVPPGATVVVCVRVFSETRPSWANDRPARAEAYALDAPELPLPTITLEELDLQREVDLDDLDIVLGLSGHGCGQWGGAFGGTEVPATLCDPAAEAESLAWGLDRNASVRITYAPPGREPATTGAMLETSVRGCGAGCTPETEWYRLPLPAVRVSSGLCGGTGDCTPPTDERILGSALLRVDWSGAGGRRWSVGSALDATRPAAAAELPQLDTFVTPAVRGPATDPQVHALLRADRPVTWDVRWLGCTRTADAGRAATDTPATSFEARLTGVCAGESGAVEVTLTDAEGRTSVWGPSREAYGDDHLYARGVLGVPAVPTVTDVVVELAPREGVAVVDTVLVVLDGRGAVRWPAGSGPGCADRAGVTYRHASWDQPLPDVVPVWVSVALREADAWSGAGPDRCEAPRDVPAQTVTFTTTVPRADLLAGPVRLTPDEGAAFDVALTMAARP